MGIVLAELQAEVKSRSAALGASSSNASMNRLKYAIRKAAKQAWEKQDWDFKNSTANLTTQAGNLGGYAAPSGLVRFATSQMISAFGFTDKDVLAPIYSNDLRSWRPYIKVQDGLIYFLADPGNQNLTLNYLATFSNSIEDAALGATLLLIADGLQDAIATLTIADLYKDLPGMAQDAALREKDGLMLVDAYWEEVTRDKYQKTIAPKGINKLSEDFYARVITVLGSPALIRAPVVF